MKRGLEIFALERWDALKEIAISGPLLHYDSLQVALEFLDEVAASASKVCLIDCSGIGRVSDSGIASFLRVLTHPNCLRVAPYGLPKHLLRRLRKHGLLDSLQIFESQEACETDPFIRSRRLKELTVILNCVDNVEGVSLDQLHLFDEPLQTALVQQIEQAGVGRCIIGLAGNDLSIVEAVKGIRSLWFKTTFHQRNDSAISSGRGTHDFLVDLEATYLNQNQLTVVLNDVNMGNINLLESLYQKFQGKSALGEKKLINKREVSSFNCKIGGKSSITAKLCSTKIDNNEIDSNPSIDCLVSNVDYEVTRSIGFDSEDLQNIFRNYPLVVDFSHKAHAPTSIRALKQAFLRKLSCGDLPKGYVETSPQLFIGPAVTISSNARLSGLVAVGPRTFIGPDVQIIGPVIIGPDCYIDGPCILQNSILLPGSYIAGDVDVRDCVKGPDLLYSDQHLWQSKDTVADFRASA